MTDRELLELASKACGLEEAKMRIEFNQWNPLEDDGDALRLAVKLEMNVTVGVVRTPAGFAATEYSEDGCRDDNELTRRAIVRAAAEIGRSMK